MPDQNNNNQTDKTTQNGQNDQQNDPNMNNNASPAGQDNPNMSDATNNSNPSNPSNSAVPSDPNAAANPAGGKGETNLDSSQNSHTDVKQESKGDEVQADKDASGTPLVHDTDIEKVVSRWTGIPITKLTEKESEKLLHMEDLIHKNFINHERAVTAVSEAIRRGRIGLASASRPIASFIFLGPTGTGKTELAKVLAEIMFGKKDAMIRLDMSEYMEKHEVAKLVGAPPGYVGYEEGGQLTEAVRAKPYSIVLLDEIEKAHPDVFNILLQLLEDGRLTDNKGNTISFKNTVIIATSNIGSQLIQQKLMEMNVSSGTPMATETATPSQPTPPSNPSNPPAPSAPGAQPGQTPPVNPKAPAQPVQGAPADPNAPQTTAQTVAGVPGQPMPPPNPSNPPAPPVPGTPAAPAGPANSIVTQDEAGSDPETVKRNKVFKELSSIVMEELTKHFRPELINRFDEVVIFEPLSQDNMMQIAKLGIEATKKMLQEQGIDLQITEAALRQLAKEGYDPAYGARPLRRLIQRSIENPIAIYLIERSAGKGDTILIDYDMAKDEFTFTKQGGQNTMSAPGTQPDPNSSMNPSQPNSQTPSNPAVSSDPSTPGTAPATPGVPGNVPVDEAPPEVTPGNEPQPPATPPQDGGAGQTKQLPDWLDDVKENAQGTGEAPEELVGAGTGGDNNQTASVGGTT